MKVRDLESIDGVLEAQVTRNAALVVVTNHRKAAPVIERLKAAGYDVTARYDRHYTVTATRETKPVADPKDEEEREGR